MQAMASTPPDGSICYRGRTYLELLLELNCRRIKQCLTFWGAMLAVEPMNFVYNLRYMGLGMLGIFIVMGVIIGVTLLTNTIFSGREKEEDDE